MIETSMIRPIPALLATQADRYGDKVAFVDDCRSVSYRDLERRVTNLAGHLAGLAGWATGGDQQSRGERADGVSPRGLIVAGNSVEVAESYLGLVAAGMVAVCINPGAAGPEIAYQLDHCGARVVITDTDLLPIVGPLLDERPGVAAVVIDRGSGTRPTAADFETLASTRPSAEPLLALDLDDTAFLLYTSGTTGRPKGVMLSQRAMLWMCAVCWGPMLGLTEGEVLLSPLPLFHSYALDLCVLGVVAAGSTVRILDRFSTAEVLARLREGGNTILAGVPTMFQYLLHGTENDEQFPDLHRCISAGAILPGPVNLAFEERFGTELLDGYGITETATMVAMNSPGSGRVPGSCGFPVTGVGVRIVDPNTGVETPVGIDGEIWVSGPGLMQGYFENPDATAEVLVDGWYKTGDLARRDTNGFITISGRTKEMIIRGGENIYPAEVEEAIMHTAGVADAAVVSMPHDDLGEVPVAFVVPEDGAPVDPESVIGTVRERLAGFKAPEHVFETDAIPRTGSGKTRRFLLQQQIPDLLAHAKGTD
ncbi:MAG: AMP-binding protein [Actinomycetota bacterium]